MEIKFSAFALPQNGSLAILIADDLKLPPLAKELDEKTGGMIAKAIKTGDFKGKKGKMLSFIAPAEAKLDYIILVGIGTKKDMAGAADIQGIGGNLYAQLSALRIKSAALLIEEKPGKFDSSEIAANIALGVLLRSYRFDKYFTKKKEEEKPTFNNFTLLSKSPKTAEKAFAKLRAIADGIFLARDVVTEPPNVIFPETLAARAEELAKVGVRVQVFDEAEMRELGMGSLLGVAQGSEQPPKMVVMQWFGAGKTTKKKPLAFLGKGVTFDTGGISIKPAGGMEDMKYDMGGAATVIGLMKTLALRKAKVNVVGVVGLVENMPDGNAQRPSDVVKSMSGQTIEVLNTDAEGRLVLADILWYCQDRFKPEFMVNLATLTGAIVISLGNQYAGLFSNNDELSKKLLASGEKTLEKLWRFPMGEAYDKQIDSPIADMQNIGSEKGAGSITAAQFLQRFVNDTPWAHLDIAGVAWTKKDQDVTPKGATGFGIRLLNQLVEDYYE